MIKIVFFGSAQFAVPSLQILANEKSIEIVLVVTKPDKPAGRGLKLTPTPLKQKALELGLVVSEKIPTVAELKQNKIEKIVVVAYGLFIPAEIYEQWPCINLHPSLLPKYRGPSPLQTALLNGDKVTGITTMLISKEMDAGDILLQKELPISENMDIQELHDICADQGAGLILKTVQSDIEKIRHRQDSAQAVICKKIEAEDSRIIPGESLEKIHNKVRAITGFIELENGRRVKILKTKIIYEDVTKGEQSKDGISKCRLSIEIVQPEGKPRMSYTEYLKGNPEIKL